MTLAEQLRQFGFARFGNCWVGDQQCELFIRKRTSHSSDFRGEKKGGNKKPQNRTEEHDREADEIFDNFDQGEKPWTKN